MKMRRFFVVVALASCVPHSSTGPAWPKAAASDKDGGQSLAPQESRQVAVVVEKSEDPKPASAVVEAKSVAVPVPDLGVVGPAVVPPAIDETIMTEDIIIEIDD